MDKKHEDVAMVAQIDKTSVFQEGIVALVPTAGGELLNIWLKGSNADRTL